MRNSGINPWFQNCLQRNKVRAFAAAVGAVASVSILATLAACGTASMPQSGLDSQATDDNVPEAALANLTFKEWCQQWGLTCPPSTQDDDEGIVAQMSPEQWKSTLSLFRALLVERNVLSFVRADLESPQFKEVIRTLGLQKLEADIVQLIDRVGLLKISLPGTGTVSVESKGQGVIAGQSSLAWLFAPQVAIKPGATGKLEMSGISFADKSKTRTENLASISLPVSPSYLWGTTNLQISQVPGSFLLNEIVLDTSALKNVKIEQALKSVTPLRDWLFAGGRKAHLGSGFFDTAAKEVGVIISNPLLRRILPPLLEKLGSVDIEKVAANPLATVSLRADGKLTCRLEMEGQPKIDLTFDKKFGVTNLLTTDKGFARAEFYGVSAKLDVLGPISPGFKLQIIEVEPTRLVIKKVPVIGEVAIPLNGEPTTLKAFACSTKAAWDEDYADQQ